MANGTLIRPYLTDKCTIKVANGEVVEATEGFAIGNLDPGPGILGSVLDAPSVPKFWTKHPTYECYAVDYQFEFVSNTSVIVTVKYISIGPIIAVTPAVNVRGGCGLVVKEYDRDYDGNPILVSNQNPAATPPITADGASGTTKRTVRAGTIKVLRPQATFVVERIRPAIPFEGGIDPIAQSVGFAGKTNLNTTLGAPPGTLMVESVGYSAEGTFGVAWRMEYEFRFDPDKFDPRISWTDDDGRPGTDLVKAPGYDAGEPADASDKQYGKKVIKAHQRVDFSPLLA